MTAIEDQPTTLETISEERVDTRISFQTLDGGWHSIGISPPIGASEEEIGARLNQAQLQIDMARQMFHPYGAEVDPANMLMPFGKYQYWTLGQIHEQEPDYLNFILFKMDKAPALLKQAAELVMNRTVPGASFEEPTGQPRAANGRALPT